MDTPHPWPGRMIVLSSLSPFYAVQAAAHGVVLLTFRVGLSTSVDWVKIIPSIPCLEPNLICPW